MPPCCIVHIMMMNQITIATQQVCLLRTLHSRRGLNKKCCVLLEQDFQESVHTLRCAAKANRIHGLICQDQDPRKQIFLKMNEEIRTLQYLIGDLTKKTSDASEELRPIKKILDTSYDLRPTREIMHNEENAVERKSVENIIQVH